MLLSENPRRDATNEAIDDFQELKLIVERASLLLLIVRPMAQSRLSVVLPGAMRPTPI